MDHREFGKGKKHVEKFEANSTSLFDNRARRFKDKKLVFFFLYKNRDESKSGAAFF